MTDSLLSFSHNNFVTFSDPYCMDDFVKLHFKPIQLDSFDPLDFYHFLKDGLLERLIKSIYKKESQRGISFIDAGVYMGSFSIAASLICRQNNFKHSIQAIEGLPNLIVPVQKNFDLYGVKDAILRNNVVGDQDGILVPICARKGFMIGATALNPGDKTDTEWETCEVESVSLASVVQQLQEYSAIVKIDIEGNECKAFKSLLDTNLDRKSIVYIIEFTSWQINSIMSEGENYGQFILNRFNVFNLSEWGNRNLNLESLRISTLSGLGDCLSHTDLLLVPLEFNLDF